MTMFVAMSQERHYYYEYSHSNYYNDSDVSSNMNLRSTVKLPAQFTLSINSDHKLLWLDCPSREEKFEAGNHTSDYYFYHYTHWTESRFWGMMMMEPELSEDDITIRMNRSYSVVTVHYIEELNSETFRSRMDTYRYVRSVSAPDNQTRRTYEQQQRENEQERKEAEAREAEREAKQRAKMEADYKAKDPVNKPFRNFALLDAEGRDVDYRATFCSGRHSLVFTVASYGFPLCRRLIKYLDEKNVTYKITAIALDDSFFNYFKSNIERTRLRDISIVKVKSIEDWTYNTSVPAIFLLDGTGKVIDFVLGFNEEDDGIKRMLNVLAELSRIEREAKMPKRFSVETKPPYKVGDYFCERGVDGVVFEVDSTGMIGKIVSMEESENVVSAFTHYSTRRIDMMNPDDGRPNTEMAKSRTEDWRIVFPAINWCTAKGEGWYMPSKNETMKFLTDKVNRTLMKYVKSESFLYTLPYLTSTESKDHVGWIYAIVINADESHTVKILNNCNWGRLRAVRRFPLVVRGEETSAPYKVGDYYCEDGVDGVVYEVDSLGRTGKILSIDFTQMAWGDATTDLALEYRTKNPLNDGERLYFAASQSEGWQLRYPAVAWCSSLGEGWTLPSVDDVKKFAGESEIHKKVSITLNKARLESVRRKWWYWTSQYGESTVVAVLPHEAEVQHKPLTEQRLVRAVRDFPYVKPDERERFYTRGEVTSAPYRVGDYYFENGIEGVVCEVDSTGQHGKIFSLDVKVCKWFNASSGGKNTLALSPTDGEANMRQIKSLKKWQSLYPAHAWCDAKGEGWYLPANEELQGLLSAKERINHCLLQVGGDDLYHRYYNRSYWTSTEMDRKTVGVAIFYGDNDADVEISEKVNPYIRARAVRRF